MESAPPPSSTPPPAAAEPASSGRFSRNSALAIVGVLALLMVLCAAVVIGYTVLSGDDGDATATEQAAIILTGTGEPTPTSAALSPSETPPSSPTQPASVTPEPSATPTATATETPPSTPTDVPSPTTTSTTAATLAPTEPPPTPAAEEGLSSQITGITLQDGVYVVEYQTAGFTETLPGIHVHFFFDTVSQANAGVPGSGPWILYGGPRPFRQYTAADRPGGASQMCVLVANADHSVQAGSGNCYPLPG